MKLYKEVSVAQINLSDRTYLHSFPERSPFLVESLKEVGLLQAPLLYESEEGLIVVSGEGRIKASLSIGVKSLPSEIISKGVSPLELHLMALHSNLFRPLNLVEKATFFVKVLKHLKENERLKMLNLLGFPVRPNFVNLLLIINNLREEFKIHLINGGLNPKIMEYFEFFTHEEFAVLLEYAITLSLTFSEQREFFALAADQKRLDRLSLFLEGLATVAYFKDFNQRRQAYRELYLRYRYPYFKAKLERLNRIKKRWALWKINVSYEPYLEDKAVDVKFRAHSLDELQKCVNFLKKHGGELFSVFE